MNQTKVKEILTTKELLHQIQRFLDDLGTAKPLYINKAKELSKAIDYHLGVLDVSEIK
tara:strand:+ start:800 stop:973 length:174 start_codon:yes stop_codon:yes gene_type:complete